MWPSELLQDARGARTILANRASSMEQPRVYMETSSQGRSTWAGGAREDEGGSVGRSQIVQNAVDDLGLRDDAQDAQRVPTSRTLRDVRREDPQQRKS